MMFKLNGFIDYLDKSALDLEMGRHDENVFELDLNLWALVHMLAQDYPHELKSSFNFNDDVIATLRSASRSSVSSLASGHLLSFVLLQSEEEVTQIINNLRLSSHPYVYLQQSIQYHDFAFAYWQILNRLSQKDVDYASIVFGISTGIVEKIQPLTDLKLRLLAAQLPPAFNLRFCQKIIIDRLQPSDTAAVNYFKSIQLSLKK